MIRIALIPSLLVYGFDNWQCGHVGVYNRNKWALSSVNFGEFHYMVEACDFPADPQNSAVF